MSDGRLELRRDLMFRLLTRSRRIYQASRRLRIVARFAARRPHEADFAGFRLFEDRSGIFLDIGANAGQSALSFRLFNKRTPILSIEPNPYEEPNLRLVKRLIRDFDYLLCGAGAENASAVLHVPMYRGVPLTGEASLEPVSAEHSSWLREHLGLERSPEFTVTERSVEIRRLDDMKLAPAFVKVDVEGHELQALQGLVETLRRHHPVILVENNRRVADQVCKFLRPLGYEAFVFDRDRTRFEPFRSQDPLNLFFLTAEAASRVQAKAG
jgi:FkbM family methyltransferase